MTEEDIKAALRRLTEDTRRLRHELRAMVQRGPVASDASYRHDRFQHYKVRRHDDDGEPSSE